MRESEDKRRGYVCSENDEREVKADVNWKGREKVQEIGSGEQIELAWSGRRD